MLAFVFESAGVGEWFVLLAVALIVAGPDRLPAVARRLGQYYAKFRRIAEGFRRQLFEIDAEFQRTAQDAERNARDVFVIEGNEATAKPVLEA